MERGRNRGERGREGGDEGERGEEMHKKSYLKSTPKYTL